MSVSASSRRRGRAPLGPRIFGGGALIVGVLAFLVAISDLQEGRDAEFSPVNAAFMPLIVTGMWVLFTAIYFVKQLINPTADYPVAPKPDTPVEEVPEPDATDPADPKSDVTDADDETDPAESDADRADADPTDVKWLAPVLLVLALVGYVLVLETLGFMLTSPPFFFAVTMIFGSRKYVRDAIIAALLSWGIYALFTGVLEVSLPQGMWPW